jgi:hypothetical protein
VPFAQDRLQEISVLKSHPNFFGFGECLLDLLCRSGVFGLDIIPIVVFKNGFKGVHRLKCNVRCLKEFKALPFAPF